MSRFSRFFDLARKQYLKLCAKFLKAEKLDLLIFGARNGNYYMDNSRALFEWYLSHRPSQKVMWLTKSRSVYDELRMKKIPVAMMDTIEGLKAAHQAKLGFYTNRALDLVLYEDLLPKDLKLVFLSHGQSVKNSRLTVKKGINNRFKNDIVNTGKQVYKAVTSSPWMASIQAKSQGLDEDKYLAVGFPRNDWMFNIPDRDRMIWNRFIDGHLYDKVVLYAPTWRMHGEPTKIFPFDDFDPESLASFLAEHRILLLLRPHIKELHLTHNLKTVNTLMQASSNVRLATVEEFFDANALLPFVDLLISDYSSIYHDFLLLDRPVAFIPYDFHQFDAENGFKYPYFEYLPGPSMYDQKDLISVLTDLIRNKDPFAQSRNTLRNKLYAHLDGNACERLASILTP